MEIREAVEADAERIAALSGSPPDVMRNLVHDRTVRVAVEDGEAERSETSDSASGEADQGEASESEDTGDEDDIAGFVSFDARGSTVHVTQIAGSRAACERLLEEPRRFAEREGMAVELLLPEDDDVVREAVEAVGFDARGDGPRFEGRPTTRYRLEETEAAQ